MEIAPGCGTAISMLVFLYLSVMTGESVTARGVRMLALMTVLLRI